MAVSEAELNEPISCYISRDLLVCVSLCWTLPSSVPDLVAAQ